MDTKNINKLIKRYGLEGTAKQLNITVRYVEMLRDGIKKLQETPLKKLIKYVLKHGEIK